MGTPLAHEVLAQAIVSHDPPRVPPIGIRVPLSSDRLSAQRLHSSSSAALTIGALIVLSLATGFVGCGEDEAAAPSPAAGGKSAGAAGRASAGAGQGGSSAGSAGKGGTGAASGSTSAGGTAGTSGSSGSTSIGGTGGASGSSGSTSAGGAAGASGSSGSTSAGGKAGSSGSSGSTNAGGKAGSAGSGGSTSAGGKAGASGSGLGGSSVGVGLAAKYPGDVGIENDPAVLFHSGFEDDLAGWTSYTKDTARIAVKSDAGGAHAGAKYLQATVTKSMLSGNMGPYVAAAATYKFSKPTDVLYWRFYARFVGASAPPHHWVRVGAGVPSYDSDGLANTVPPGDKGFWFDFDARDSGIFSFYAYWWKMRSGRCNDGTAVPGCAGDQGTTYYYGNNFAPAKQTAFPRDQWLCIELKAKANTVGTSDGELAYYRDDALVGAYVPGSPRGRWLRDNFYTWGQYYSDDQDFEGFAWRSAADVQFRKITLDAYYELGSLTAREKELGVKFPEAQQIQYDDVVVATERIGCRTTP